MNAAAAGKNKVKPKAAESTAPRPGTSKQNGKLLNLSTSETTIYHNALNKADENRVDPEITFQFIDHRDKQADVQIDCNEARKPNDQNCSSSSDD